MKLQIFLANVDVGNGRLVIRQSGHCSGIFGYRLQVRERLADRVK